MSAGVPVPPPVDPGLPSQPYPFQGADGGSPASEDSQCSSQENWRSDEMPIMQACLSEPGSPRRSEQGESASGRFSPEYEPTSPSFSPRGSQDMDCTLRQAAGLEEAAPSFVTPAQEPAAAHQANADDTACTDAAFHVGTATQSEQSSTAQETRGSSHADKAATARPATAPGRAAPSSGSRFVFAQPAAAQAEAHAQGGGAAGSPTATTEAPDPGSPQAATSSSSPPGPAEEPNQGSDPPPTFVWGQTESGASQHSSSSFVGTAASTAPFGSAQAGGSSPGQSETQTKKGASRRKVSAKGRPAVKQAGSVPTGTESFAWAPTATSMHGFRFGGVSSQSAVGAESSMPSSAAEDSPSSGFTCAGSSQPTPVEQPATATGSAANCSFTFGAGSASGTGSVAEAGASSSSRDVAAANNNV